MPGPYLQYLELCFCTTVYSGYSGHAYSGHSDRVASFPGTKYIYMTYQKTMAIREYLAFSLRSAIVATCIFVITAESRQSRGSQQSQQDRLGYSEIGIQLFFVSQLFMVQFSYGFQLNDGNILLSTVLVSDKAQIYFLFSSL